MVCAHPLALRWLQAKIWNVQSGFWFVTCSDHSTPVTAVAFLPSSNVVVRLLPCDLLRAQHAGNMFTSWHSLALTTNLVCLQVKIWNVQSGFCFVTFSDHSAPVTAVAFLPSSSVVVSASLDGTVRAFDLVRYRNFRTMTAPHPVQFVSLAVDPAGKVGAILTL